MRSGASPSRRQRRLAVQSPARNPAATSTPYQWMGNEPRWNAIFCTSGRERGGGSSSPARKVRGPVDPGKTWAPDEQGFRIVHNRSVKRSLNHHKWEMTEFEIRN